MSRFLYKINSGYDGFQPAKIPERLVGNRLRLQWKLYIDNVQKNDEVWVYFHGKGNYEKGVYLQGVVREIDIPNRAVFIRVSEYDTHDPLTDGPTSLRVAEVVTATKFRQVFLYPQEWEEADLCTIDSTVQSCRVRACSNCPTWQSLPIIGYEDCAFPARLKVDDFYPAYWVVPRPCGWTNASIQPLIHRSSEIFYRFKNGEQRLAYPLALGIYETLQHNDEGDYDGIVPIPLSPDKAALGEMNRTRVLAAELARLLHLPILDVLSLQHPISKRRMRLTHTKRQFETAYKNELLVDDEIQAANRVLLLDDVSTHGSTLTCAAERIWDVAPDIEITAVTAGQMLLREVVTNETPFVD